jgi:hypothetical protein
MGPRKYRNIEEKTAICEEVIKNLKLLPVDDDTCEGIKKLKEVLEAFKTSEKGQFKGSIPITELNATIEYDLPTRRIFRHYIRFGKPQA